MQQSLSRVVAVRLVGRSMANSRLIRSLVAGVIALVAQTAVFEMLGIYLRLFSPSTAVLVSAEIGVLTSFYLNDRFSFSDRRLQVSLPWRLARFHAVVSGSVFIQWLFVFLTERQTTDILLIHAAYAAGIIVGFAWNYTFYLLFVWQGAEPEKG